MERTLFCLWDMGSARGDTTVRKATLQDLNWRFPVVWNRSTFSP